MMMDEDETNTNMIMNANSNDNDNDNDINLEEDHPIPMNLSAINNGNGNSNDSSNTNNNNFTQIQSRKFRKSTIFPNWSLCPSMDLIALGSKVIIIVDHSLDNSTTTATNEAAASNNNSNFIAESIAVHRIISWQSLLQLKGLELTSAKQEDSSTTNDADDDGGGGRYYYNDGLYRGICLEDLERDCRKNMNQKNNAGGMDGGEDDGIGAMAVDSVDDVDDDASPKLKGATSICWSPDGRYVAIGLVDGGVLIHTVEPHHVNGGAGDDAGAGGDYGEGGGGSVLCLIRPPPPSSSSSSNAVFVHPSPSNAAVAAASGGGSTAQNRAFFSPRVTRSMASNRGGGGNATSATSKHNKRSPRSTSRSKSPGGQQQQRRTTTSTTTHHKGSNNNPQYPLAIIGMVWKRFVSQKTIHNNNNNNVHELEVRESWRYASQLIGRGSHFLPNSSNGHSDNNGSGGGGGASNSGVLGGGGGSMNNSNNNNNMNILCIATPKEIHWYLQGQYRILSTPHGLDDRNNSALLLGGIDLVCSPDLSTILVSCKPVPGAILSSSSPIKSPRNLSSSSSLANSSKSSMKAKLFISTLLPRKRHDLQVLTSLYRSVFTHLKDAQKGLQSAYQSWKLALRPLDTKFNGLLGLLTKYNVDSSSAAHDDDGAGGAAAAAAASIRLEFLRFILSGRSTVAGNASSALDQFFTRAQMHDQLLQREARGVEASVATMESNLRSNVLSSIRAVVYEAEELYGLATSSSSGGGGGSAQQTTMTNGSNHNLIDADMALRLYASSRVLYLTFDQCLGYVVEARTRLHDLLAWIRGTASQVRAWGTAVDSIQRQNARARRISNGVVQRVSSFLSKPMVFALDNKDGGSGINGCVDRRILTECVIGMPLSDFFVAANDQASAKEVPLPHGTRSIRSLKSAVQSMFQMSTILFDRPRNVFAQSLDRLDICFEEQHSCMAIHTRIGAGPSANTTRDDATGFFVPKTLVEGDDSIDECPFWSLLARSLGSEVEFIVIPGDTRFEPDVNRGFYLRATLIIPEGSEVSSIAFYGDDGNSSLSPNLKNDIDVKEGRQSVGLVMNSLDPISQEVREELWVVQYDDIVFQKFDCKRNSKREVNVAATVLDRDACTFLMASDDEGNEANNVIVQPKRRHLSTHRMNSQTQRQSQMNLCGSRGTGGVIYFGTSTTLTMYDLEEDEENSSEGDDDHVGLEGELSFEDDEE